MSNPSSNCTAARAALPLFVGGDMEPQEMAQVKAHLDDCGTCRLHEDRARQARGALVSMLRSDESASQGSLLETSVWEGLRADLIAAGLIAGVDGVLVPRPALHARGQDARQARPLARPRLRVAGLAAAAGLVFALGMIHFLGGDGSGLNNAPVAGDLGGAVTVRTHSAVHGVDSGPVNPGHLRLVEPGGVAIHDLALELVPEQGWVVPQANSLKDSNLARNPRRRLRRAVDDR